MAVMEFELIRICLALAMLGTASYFDLRKREVSDLLWVVFAAAAGIVYVFDFPSSLGEGIAIVISIALTAAVAYGIYRVGLFGGADMLALITLSAIMPLLGGTLLDQERVAFHEFAPLIVLTNAIILSIAHVIFNVIRNLVYYSRRSGILFEGLQHEPVLKKIFAMIVGHRSKNPQFDFPIERTVDGKREFDFSFKAAETAEYEARNDVWVTSGIPYLIYLVAGFVVMIAGGDLLAIIFLNLSPL